MTAPRNFYYYDPKTSSRYRVEVGHDLFGERFVALYYGTRRIITHHTNLRGAFDHLRSVVESWLRRGYCYLG